ncbi:MAG: acetate/propionate family kinase, partial [Anaerolineae bacterium]|nr:acetate/propionate family kinase [Anaerolineae bacterium]
LLGQIPLFKSFRSTELKSLIEKSRLDTFAPRDVIIPIGQAGQFLGVVLEGKAEAVITDEMGERQQIGLVNQGEFLGEISLLTGEPTVADVIALEKCELLLIPQEVFAAFLSFKPDALQVIAKTITQRLRWRERDKMAQTRVEDAWRNAPDPYGLRLSTTTPMKILTIDCADAALKFGYFDTALETNNLQGEIKGIGSDNPHLIYTSEKGRARKDLWIVDHVQALAAVVTLLTDRDQGVLETLDELDAVGHKVVHGGDRYSNAAIIDAQVIKHVGEYARFAPNHNPLNLIAIQECIKLMPQVPQVAVFDTGFHQKMPLQAHLYGLPYDMYQDDHIRRYGFHGISHQYVALEAAAHLKRHFPELKIITCHLDDEASLCAIDHGRSVDTSMGLAPLEGLIMGTKCGDLDPAIIIHLLKEKGLSIEQVDEILNRQSGLKGLSGISGDFRELEDAASKGDHRSIAAIQAFCYRIRKTIGAYTSAISGLDALVFTGHIGEGSAWVRSLTCQGLSYMNILVDDVLNKMVPPRPKEVMDISDKSSLVQVLVIPTDEVRMIARETIRTLGYRNVAQVIKRQQKIEIPIEVSAHHVHLSQEHVKVLFGPGYELTHRADLSQPGQYACEETVNLIGHRGRVERVRILGPVRNQTQVEIAMTEEFRLGIKAPIRPSGDLEGSPGITLEGSRGTLDIPQGVICAARHIHMSPADALSFGLKNRDVCMIRVEGERTLIFGDVLVRVNPDYKLAMHLDTDEANAASIRTGMIGHLAGVQDRR